MAYRTERDFIRQVVLAAGPGPQNVVVPNGDDAAVFRSGGKLVACSVDAVVEGTHFSLSYSTPVQVGMKAVETSVSDIIAVGGRPEFILVSLTLPTGAATSLAEEVFCGVQRAAARCGVVVIGGDTTSGGCSLQIAVTSLGSVPSEEWLTPRSGALPGDLIFVTGPLGASAAGLYALIQGVAGFESLKRVHLEPRCRIDLAQSIGGVASAAIDISDGLSSELHHICEASAVGCVVNEARLPVYGEVSTLAELCAVQATDWIWNGGEDYELLFTCHPSEAARAPGVQIGVVTAERRVLRERDGAQMLIALGGFDHFSAG